MVIYNGYTLPGMVITLGWLRKEDPSDGGLYCPPDARSMCGYAGRHPTDDPPMSVTYLVHTGSSRSDIGRLLSNV